MAEVTYSWPAKDKATTIGKRYKRLDGPEKSTGKAKYAYDINLKDMLIAKGLGCPHAHCRIRSIDTAPAEKVKGIVHIEML
jgi:xanthine dehydrogenase YagR molybdenum-binding subunit